MFIAASASLQLLEIAEKRHRCPSLSTLQRDMDFLRSIKPGEPTFLASAADLGLDPIPENNKVDRLLRELGRKEKQLDLWLRSSEANARWFRRDPIGAIRAANLGIEEEILKELESVTAAIVQKLKPHP